ncbi:MAG: YraN family protein [Moraxella sp.]|nr:YraN family protein [Moraxella sp.]
MQDDLFNHSTAVKEPTKTVGDNYERVAAAFLETQGLSLVKKNYSVPRVGEIDIIAYQRKTLATGKSYETLICVEVRARKHSQFSSAAETVTRAKQKRLIATMQHFLMENAQYEHCDVRFDVLAFDILPTGVQYNWIQAAFLS